MIDDIAMYTPWYRSPAKRCVSSEEGLSDAFIELKIHSVEQFSETERELLMSLPRRALILDKSEHQLALLGLVDILFGYCYDHRITYGEPCIESPWNICKLSTQLSWLSAPTSLHQSLLTSYSRALSYPLFRNYSLVQSVRDDVIAILGKGRHVVLRCFLMIYNILRKHDYYYLLNMAYIQDYCIWLQNIKDGKVERLGEAVSRISVSKADLVTLNLVQIDEIIGQCEGSSEEGSESEYSDSESCESSSSSCSSEESSEGLAASEDEEVAGINIKDLTFVDVDEVKWSSALDDSVSAVDDVLTDDKENCNVNIIAAHTVVQPGKVLIEEI